MARMNREERLSVANSIVKMLPLEPSPSVKVAFMSLRYNNPFSCFRYIRESENGVTVKAVKVLCGACLKESVYPYYKFNSEEITLYREYHIGCAADSYGFFNTHLNVIQQTNDTFVCPECGCRSVLSSFTRMHYRCLCAMEEQAQEVLNVNGHLVLVLWKLSKWVNRGGEEDFGFERLFSSFQVGGVMYRANGYENWYGNRCSIGNWVLKQGGFTELMGGVLKRSIFWDPKDLSGAEEFNDGFLSVIHHGGPSTLIHLESYLSLWSKFPAIENLAKFSPKFVSRFFFERYEYKTPFSRASLLFDLTKKKPHEIVGVPKVDAMALLSQYHPYQVFVYSMLVKSGSHNPESAFSLTPVNAHAFVDFLARDVVKAVDPPFVRLFNYVAKHDFAFTFIADYWRMAIDVEGSVSIPFPRNLVEMHDRFSDRLRLKRNRPTDIKIRQRFKKLSKYIFSDSSSGFLIRPVRNSDELIREGKYLRHCVGSYVNLVASGQTSIFFIRKIEEPDVPFYTLEYMNGRIVQDHGFENKLQTPEILAFEKSWLEYIKGGVK